MSKQLTEKELWELIGFVKISPHRLLILKALKNSYLMPSEIARLTGLRTTQASSALNDLKRKELVVCMNESAHKGRLYKHTDTGRQIMDLIENNNIR